MSAVSRVVVAHPSALKVKVTVPGPGPIARADAIPLPAPRKPPPAWVVQVIAMTTGLVVFVALWAFVAKFGRIPDPLSVFKEAVVLFSNPFYKNGPNDQGIGWNILTSLGRVAIGFGAAAAVGIPLGFAIGRFRFLSDMAAPIIALLKPVSPLAWLPIGLLLFKKADPAAIYVIFICSLWPMIVNTAVGVRQIPQDYLNVARVLNLSEWKIFTKILFPAVLPYMLTGVRLSIGVAWLVIVAAEMLTGGVGIGFWVWDEWNNLKVDHILIAIFVIGIVGLALEQMLVFIAKRFSHGVNA
ncbi:Bicarbonate transport system permease protein CmpB [Usitatibacter rugosus]|uniref:Bicarbonate transport system permease protein CmpB n=1 Tax=Usitatibacter rugosus TaxID=2732067 RepID=A0A6M4GU61_9PROT|nr:nitrate ABC transporter permease [Usitatibacter rugosus]QJR09873.1 Bicarbonate transport system permease protein CmpB [Usitatibacter rugosus]